MNPVHPSAPDGGRSGASVDQPVPSVDRFRQAILVNAGPALRELQRSAMPGADRLILLAEALLRLGRDDAAVAAGIRAAAVAEQQQPVPVDRLLSASTVRADLAIWVGDPGAAQTCRGVERLAASIGDQPRRFLAIALRAVALYQHSSCRAGTDRPAYHLLPATPRG
ncbi:hypothetical protein Acy02nite_89660 [Actinoplanes cyaneus]|uniref:Uncharacterized protein n=1 Tax=Actinoplanes cyaneus TaxID=52696 RepID=A0A919IRV6_9ACTN|nr:hypothetical protein [Actinoplanes cyaneus]MCW2144329.1 hypothetical protein [Actinoplanes cyaneus]GID71085.1 hypothetical protein Acy02nite_89660 [Actinoplanes cyaneus]